MNQPFARVNQPYATLMLASALREMFGVQFYKNNARALLLRILSILNLDWLQHARSVRGVYEYMIMDASIVCLFVHLFVFVCVFFTESKKKRGTLKHPFGPKVGGIPLFQHSFIF